MDNKGQIGILDVPNEILFRIFRFLTIQDVQRNLALVCKRFFRISRMDGMVISFEFELSIFANEAEVEKNLAKIRLLLEQHPRAQLKLKFHEEVLEKTCFVRCHRNIYQVARISSSIQSIKSLQFVFTSDLALSIFFKGISIFEESIKFESIKELEITKKDEKDPGTSSSSVLFFTPCFWRNFPNLKNLTMQFFFNEMVCSIYCNASSLEATIFREIISLLRANFRYTSISSYLTPYFDTLIWGRGRNTYPLLPHNS